MNKYLLIVAYLPFAIGPLPANASTTSPVLKNVTSNYYPWTSRGSANFSIPIPGDFNMAFSVRFTANPTQNLYIGVHSPDFIAQCALGPYRPDAVIEMQIGGWDSGTNDTQRSAVYFGIETETGYYRKRILFTDDATPHQRYIIPGSRGSYIEYTYTFVTSPTTCGIILEYLDPTTAQQKTLLHITDADFPPDILRNIQASTFAGFSSLGFHTYNAPYNVKDASIIVPQALIDAARSSLNTARALLSPTLSSNIQNLHDQAAAALITSDNIPDTEQTKTALISAITAIQNTATKDLASITNAQNQLTQIAPPYTTPRTAITARTTAELLASQLTIITQRYADTTEQINAIKAQMVTILTALNAPSINSAIVAAQQNIGQALRAVQSALAAIQVSNDHAQAAVANALLLPDSVSNRSALIDAAQQIQTNPTTGTICYLNYLINAQSTLTDAPSTYESIEAAQSMQSNAIAMHTVADEILRKNTDIQRAIAHIQDSVSTAQDGANLIAQMQAITDANNAAQQSIQDALAGVTAAQRLIQTADDQASLTITASQQLPPFAAIDTSSLLRTAEALKTNPTTGTTALLTSLANLLHILHNFPATFTQIDSAQNAQQIALAAKATSDSIAAQNPSILAAINNVGSMINDVRNVIESTLLSNARTLANAHIAGAISALENAQLLTHASDKQVESTLKIIQDLPDSINQKTDFYAQATALFTSPEITQFFSSSLARLRAYAATYETIASAQAAQQTADDASARAQTITAENHNTIAALYALQSAISVAQNDANSDLSALALASATTTTHISSASIAVQRAQLLNQEIDTRATQAIIAVRNLPDTTENKQNLLTLINNLLPPASVSPQLTAALTTLSQMPSTFQSVTQALAAQRSADAIAGQAQGIIEAYPNTIAALINAEKAVTQAQNNNSAAALFTASAEAIAQIETTINVLQAALALIEQITTALAATVTTTNALSDTVQDKESFLRLLSNLSVDQATSDYLATSLSTLQNTSRTFSSLDAAQNAKLSASAIASAAHSIMTTVQNSLNSLASLTQSIDAARLATATRITRSHVLSAIVAFENAIALIQSTDKQAQNTLEAAQKLTGYATLLDQAQQLSTNPNSGTRALLAVSASSLNILQTMHTTFSSIESAVEVQRSADALYATAQQIIMQNSSILQNIARINALLETAQQASTPPPNPNPTPTQPQLPSGISPLEKLNATISLELAAAQQLLVQAQTSGTQAYLLIQSIIKKIAASSVASDLALLSAAASLESALLSILNKITATQATLNKQTLPFTDQALALKAKAIVESSATYAKTAVSLISARMQSIMTLQSQISS